MKDIGGQLVSSLRKSRGTIQADVIMSCLKELELCMEKVDKWMAVGSSFESK
jgi:hypothetical protein